MKNLIELPKIKIKNQEEFFKLSPTKALMFAYSQKKKNKWTEKEYDQACRKYYRKLYKVGKAESTHLTTGLISTTFPTMD